MNRSKEPVLSTCERQFTLEAIKERKRVDGRSIYDYRHVTITPSPLTPGNVLVLLGETRVQACVACELAVPRPQRPTDGMLYFNVMPSTMASPAYEISGRSSLTIKIERLLDRCFKESRSVDTESLCIIAGEKVWSVRVDLHILNNCGNVTDCCVLAALTALKHFRRPDVSVVGEEATIHPVTERESVPLNIHHSPISVSFGFCCDGEYLLVDPTHLEEQVLTGQMSLVMNIHREICTLQLEGVALLPDQVTRCTKIALAKVNELNDLIKTALSVTKETNGQSVLMSTLKQSSKLIEKRKAVEEIQEKCEDVILRLEERVGEIPCVLSSEVMSAEEASVNKWPVENDSEEEGTLLLTEQTTGGLTSIIQQEQDTNLSAKSIVSKPGSRRKRKRKT